MCGFGWLSPVGGSISMDWEPAPHAHPDANVDSNADDLPDSPGQIGRRQPVVNLIRSGILVGVVVLLLAGAACSPEPYPTATPSPTATHYPREATPTPTPRPPTATPRPTIGYRASTVIPRTSTTDRMLQWQRGGQPTIDRITRNALQGVPPNASDCRTLTRLVREGNAIEPLALNDTSVSVHMYSAFLDALSAIKDLHNSTIAGGFC